MGRGTRWSLIKRKGSITAGLSPFKQQLNVMELINQNNIIITAKKKYFLVVLYSLVALFGFVSSYWTTNFVWMLLIVIPAIISFILAIYWLRFGSNLNRKDV